VGAIKLVAGKKNLTKNLEKREKLLVAIIEDTGKGKGDRASVLYTRNGSNKSRDHPAPQNPKNPKKEDHPPPPPPRKNTWFFHNAVYEGEKF